MKKDLKISIIVIIIIFIIAGGITLGVLLNKTETTEDEISEVSFKISCVTILDNYDNLKDELKNEKYVPSDGIILNIDKLRIKENENLLSFITKITRENRIHFDFSAGYIKGVNNIYEYDCGKQSGWMYKVNGVFPKVGVNQYLLSHGDIVELVYTCNNGKDVGDIYQG